MRKFLPTPDAVQLLMEGAAALSQVSANGVRIDKDYLDGALTSTAEQIKQYEDALRSDADYHLWRRRFGTEVNFKVNRQLATVIFGDLGFKRKEKLSDAKDTDDEGEFEGIEHPLVKNFFSRAKIENARSTFLLGIQREIVRHDDGNYYVHPHYHLNTVATFRSSASSPNFQNVPIRNPIMGEIIRRTYISRRGQQIIETDQGQQEARVPECYSHDPELLAYWLDPSKDMHYDQAEELFLLKRPQITKPLRQISKNAFVFATLYGDYYRKTAAMMWEDLVLQKITIKDSPKMIIEHLAENGITERGDCHPKRKPRPGTFEHHVQQVEGRFWDKFAVHAEWKESWFRDYQRNGGCMFLSGFPMIGPHSKNDITNYCIQGFSFHINLWALIQINRKLRKHKFRTCVIGEIHDCIDFDGPPSERDDVIELAIKSMTVDVRKHWPCITVPLVVEPEACPVDGNWFDKHALTQRNGTWVPSDLAKWNQKFGAWV